MIKTFQWLCLTALLSLPLLFQSSFTEILKLKTFDRFTPAQEPSGYFTILNITEEDVVREGGYPIPRYRLAEIHRDILEAGALGVGYVITFSEPDRMGGDELFSEILRLSPSVLSMFEHNNYKYPDTTGVVLLGDDVGGMTVKGVTENIDILKQSASQGLASAPIDIDGLVRRIPLLMRTEGGWTSSFGLEILKVMAGADTYIIKTNQNGLQEVVAQGLPPAKVDSLGRKFISWVDTKQTTLEELHVAGTFVILGVTANGVMPQISTPVGLLEPHKVQAALAESILIDTPYIPDYSLSAELSILIVTTGLIWLLLNFLGITAGITSSTIIVLLTAYMGRYLILEGLLIDVTWTLISQLFTSGAAFYLNFRTQFKLRRQIKQQFGKYLDPRMVKKLQDNPELCQVNGKRVDCSIIFTDLRNFTSLSEQIEPEQVTYIMNSVLDAQVDAVNQFSGVTDKFIGDAGMFHWNTIIPQEDHHNLALQAALQMQENLKELNKKFVKEGIPEVACGVGLNSGICVAGNLGARDRFAFSLIGTPCNIAARLESSTKTVGVGCLIGEETAKHSNIPLKLLEPLSVKGIDKPLKVFTWID